MEPSGHHPLNRLPPPPPLQGVTFEVIDLEVQIVKTFAGRELAAIYQGYHFRVNQRRSNTIYWRCRANNDKCKASLATTLAGELLRANTDHAHPPAKFNIRNGVKKQITWRCSTHNGKGCKARVVTDIEQTEVIRTTNTHNHPPGVYELREDGFYIRKSGDNND
ncbi:FLYWCH zinc finger domain-containing protein [Phthorimaea operculella]|nr:FLYWCH zinc finger domain-containing protein [Phthorimaea operculella]